MATVKKYNLAGVSTSLELGKQGSYISGNASAIGFYTSGDALQKIAIANATSSTQAVTKAQLDATASDLVQHVTLDVDFDTSGASNIATIAAGSRILSVTVDIPTPWSSGDATDYVEVGDTSNGSRFIRAGDIDVTKAAQYHSQYQYEYSAESVLTVEVTNGSASAGSATVSIVLASDSISVTDYGSVNSAQNSNSDLGNIS
jgi:hypothetical protein|tara:strand:- start:683 stop:1288 length:606 start_codon:yes stop_codon:yes gene_type:complete